MTPRLFTIPKCAYANATRSLSEQNLQTAAGGMLARKPTPAAPKVPLLRSELWSRARPSWLCLQGLASKKSGCFENSDTDENCMRFLNVHKKSQSPAGLLSIDFHEESRNDLATTGRDALHNDAFLSGNPSPDCKNASWRAQRACCTKAQFTNAPNREKLKTQSKELCERKDIQTLPNHTNKLNQCPVQQSPAITNNRTANNRNTNKSSNPTLERQG